VRFNKAETFERLVALEKEIWEQAGEQVDLDSGRSLARLLFEKLKLPPPGSQDPAQVKKPASRRKRSPSSEQEPEYPGGTPGGEPEPPPDLEAIASPLPARPVGHEPTPDPPAPLREAHPIMPLLLEYRQVEASSARLAPRAVYDRIKRGDVDLPITSLKLRLKLPPQT
jgi:hypothetical protein